jgi:hypothetical protein
MVLRNIHEPGLLIEAFGRIYDVPPDIVEFGLPVLQQRPGNFVLYAALTMEIGKQYMSMTRSYAISPDSFAVIEAPLKVSGLPVNYMAEMTAYDDLHNHYDTICPYCYTNYSIVSLVDYEKNDRCDYCVQFQNQWCKACRDDERYGKRDISYKAAFFIIEHFSEEDMRILYEVLGPHDKHRLELCKKGEGIFAGFDQFLDSRGADHGSTVWRAKLAMERDQFQDRVWLRYLKLTNKQDLIEKWETYLEAPPEAELDEFGLGDREMSSGDLGIFDDMEIWEEKVSLAVSSAVESKAPNDEDFNFGSVELTEIVPRVAGNRFDEYMSESRFFGHSIQYAKVGIG